MVFSFRSFRKFSSSISGEKAPVLRHLSGALLLLFSATSAGLAATPPSIMNYRIVEAYYGPEIRFHDWRVTSGNLLTDHTFRETRGAWQSGGEGVNALFSAGGRMQIYTTGAATVTRSDYLFGGGGDVEIRLAFEIERMAESGSFTLRCNDGRTGEPGAGLSVSVTPDVLTIRYRSEPVYSERFSLRPGQLRELTIATLAEEYRVDLDGRTLFAGRLEPNSQDNEGWTHLDVAEAGIRIHSFAENLIAHNVSFAEWERTDLLYEEAFGSDSWRHNWVLNGETPDIAEDSFIFRPMSNVILDRRFDGPIVVDIEATPVPTDEFSAGITDAIFIWMMDHPDGDLPGFMRGLPDAGRGHYLPLPFYWMDFGGTNNVTTRFRRSPDLRMIRQFTDAPRLMERDRTYQVSLVQHGHTVEYWVDGERWIQAWDPEPLTSGYIGHRAFNSQLKVSGIKVWRIE
jgi:hypothetical protein